MPAGQWSDYLISSLIGQLVPVHTYEYIDMTSESWPLDRSLRGCMVFDDDSS